MHTLRRWLKPTLTGTLLFVGLSHHLLNFWEWPGLWILTGLFTLLPLSIGGMAIVVRRFGPFVKQIPKPTLTLYLVAALLLGGFVTWRTYRLPQSYQTLIITTITKQVALVEIKNNGNPLSLERNALESGWQVQDGLVHAAQESKPLHLTFQTPIGQPISLLFLTSPKGGTTQVTLNGRNSWLNLNSERMGQTALRLTAEYRGLPGAAFRFLLLFSSLFSFGTIGLLLLVIQHIGQENLPQKTVLARMHQRNLLILSLAGLCVYTFNALTVPLTINPDSHGLLQGSFHLLQHGNLDGVSMYRGPGTTFLFAPVLYAFGNNAWGIKILLHLFAFACLFPAYRLGWQWSGSYAIALIAGFLVVFSPDLMAYASVVMSDVPNILVVLTFLTLHVSALQKPEPRWVFATLLTGSLAVLLRSENLVMLVIGAIWLMATPLFSWRRTRTLDTRRLQIVSLAILASALPILWWSAHNQRVHGFFGMSNYQGEVFYDGWVYYGDALGTPFSNPDSLAFQVIQKTIEVYPIEITDQKGVPTGWEIYPAMLAAGYTPNQAFDLMESAAWDSIRANPARAVEILFNKYQRGLTPGLQPMLIYPLPGEDGFVETWRDEYFYQKTPNLPLLIGLRRAIDDGLRANYPRLYPGWVLFALLTVFLSFFRAPRLAWSAHVLIMGSRILFPMTIGVAFWRYALAGWIPAQITAIVWLWVFAQGLIQLRSGKTKGNLPQEQQPPIQPSKML